MRTRRHVESNTALSDLGVLLPATLSMLKRHAWDRNYYSGLRPCRRYAVESNPSLTVRVDRKLTSEGEESSPPAYGRFFLGFSSASGHVY
jgi:hypothetical protein